MIGFKLFRKRRDGSYGPLFINRSLRIYPDKVYKMEDHPTPGYAHRPGWHICAKKHAPHLRQDGDRVWCQVEFEPFREMPRPEHQGGLWFLGSSIRVIKELT